MTLAGLQASRPELDVDLLTLDEALAELAALNPDRVRLVELQFFGGLTETEAGDVLGISRREATRQWRTVKAWLRTRLETDADVED